MSHTKHSRALSDARKAEMELLVARTANEREQASLRAAGEVLEVSRKHARETTEMLREKMEEVERLRMYKQVDDRERAVKVKGLIGGVSPLRARMDPQTLTNLGRCRRERVLSKRWDPHDDRALRWPRRPTQHLTQPSIVAFICFVPSALY